MSSSTQCSYRRESGDVLVPVGAEVLLSVVDGHSTIDTCGQGIVLHDLHTLVGAVGGVLEEEHGCPVVGEILSN
jgi:hypothetical protein